MGRKNKNQVADEGAGHLSSVRVDKWLWAARFFKTRSLASDACDGGHVKVNGATVRSSRQVKPGDQVTVMTPGGLRMLDVVALGDKRGPAAEARALYQDNTPEELRRPKVGDVPLYAREARQERGKRPKKRDRRALRKLRGR